MTERKKKQPQDPPQPVAAPASVAETEATDAGAAPGESGPSGLRSVLVAEPDSVAGLVAALGAETDLDVRAANSRDGLMARLRQGHTDLLVLDLALVRPAPVEFLTMLRAQEDLRNLAILVVTSSQGFKDLLAGPPVLTETLEIVVQPFDLEELRARVRHAFRWRGMLASRPSPTGWRLERRQAAGKSRREAIDAVIGDVAAVLPMGLALVDSGMNVLYANNRLCELLGAPAPQVLRRNLHELFAETLFRDPRMTEAVDRTIRTGAPSSVAGVSYAPPGATACYLDVRWQQAGPKRRENPAWLFILDDTTGQYASSKSAEQERRRLDTVVERLSAGLLMVGAERMVSWANPQARAWLPACVGSRVQEVFPGAMDADGTDPATQALAQGKPITMLWTGGHPQKTFKMVFTPLEESGQPTSSRVLVLLQDVTREIGQLQQQRLIRQLVAATLEEMELDRQLHLVLTGVTAGHALGFNRAFLFMIDQTAAEPGIQAASIGNAAPASTHPAGMNVSHLREGVPSSGALLTGRMGVGPASREEAHRIWAELSDSNLSTILTRDRHVDKESLPLYNAIRDLAYPIPEHGPSPDILVRCVQEKALILVRGARNDPRVTPNFLERFGTEEFVVVPLIARGDVLGVILADNLYSGAPISHEQVELLAAFASPAALAISFSSAIAATSQALEELKSAQQRLVATEKLAVIGRLASHVAHEIRNPLVTIGGFAKAIFKRPDRPQRIQKNALIISDEVSRLEQILSDVMDFTRPARPVLVDTRLGDLISHVMDPLMDELGERGVSCVLEVTDDLPTIPADRKQIQQVFLNIIKNAVDAMPHGGTLSVRTDVAAEGIVTRFRDTGVGITAEVQANMFNPFYTTKTSGTGLGLAVSLKIVEDHGGTIKVNSMPGEGVEVSVILPSPSLA